MEDIISQTKSELIRAKERMAHALVTTPDDRINWAPSSTARTPLQQVAHSAQSISSIHDMLGGKRFPYAGTGELDTMPRLTEKFDTAQRFAEKEFTTRDQVLSLLEQTSAEYFDWLDRMTPALLASTVKTPFGPTPMVVAITFPASHMTGHVAQMDYIQTIYGDQDWHL